MVCKVADRGANISFNEMGKVTGANNIDIGSFIEGERRKYIKKHYGIDSDYLAKTKELDHDKWLMLRKLGVAGSDLGGITGISKYSSKIKVYLDKIGELEPIKDNEKMYWGRVMEDVIANEFKVRNKEYKVQKVNVILRHREHGWAIGNIDRLIINEKGERGILEIKTVSEYLSDMWENDVTPMEYMVQLQWYMFVADVRYGYFAALIGGNKYIQKYVERDDELIEMLLSSSEKFWKNNVLKKVPPPIDGSKATTELIKGLYPESVKGSEMVLPKDTLGIINKLEALKAQEKELQVDIAKCENEIKDLLKDNEIGICGERKVTWKLVIKKSVNGKKLKADYPDIYANYSSSTSYRQLTLSKVK